MAGRHMTKLSHRQIGRRKWGRVGRQTYELTVTQADRQTEMGRYGRQTYEQTVTQADKQTENGKVWRADL